MMALKGPEERATPLITGASAFCLDIETQFLGLSLSLRWELRCTMIQDKAETL